MFYMFQRGVKLLAVVCLLALFSGCAATQTAISKRNLDVQSKMSATVFWIQ